MINEELVDTEKRGEEIAPIISLAGKRIIAENVGLWSYPGLCWSGNAELTKLWMKINWKLGDQPKGNYKWWERETGKSFLGIGNVLRQQDKATSGLWQTWENRGFLKVTVLWGNHSQSKQGAADLMTMVETVAMNLGDEYKRCFIKLRW